MEIICGLPYDTSLMNEIKENGAIIDMSNINYPSIPSSDNVRISYIYLRNTDFNVDLNFDNCDYQFKEDFVYFYMFGDITYDIKEMNDTWMQIMIMYNNQYTDILTNRSILTKDEITKFIEKYKDKIDLINKFLFSLALFPIYRLNNVDLPKDDVQVLDEKPFTENVYGLIKHELFNPFLTLDGIDKPIYFKQYFTENNNQLFELIAKYTPYAALLHGLFNSSSEDWSNFVNNLEVANEKNATNNNSGK